ncbi:hypothetical protein LTR08_009064 [Meristemomyces frigidus]|nr:hypothetical protein LTR08_009064 [Meristemomyces frigidus]
MSNNLHDFHTVQASHYLGKNSAGMRDSLLPSHSSDTPPPVPPKNSRPAPGTTGLRPGAHRPQDSAYPTLPVVQRKPVGPANQAAAPQPPPPVGLRRKPVADGGRIQLSVPPPVPEPRPQAPRGQMRTIFTNADGKVDLATVRNVSATRWVPSVSPLEPALLPEYNPALPRPDSQASSGKSFGWGNRVDTNGSSKSGSRRSSLTDMVKAAGRRLSGAFKEKAEIIRMAPSERDDWLIARHEQKKRSTANLLADERNPNSNAALAHDYRGPGINADGTPAHSKSPSAQRQSVGAARAFATSQGKTLNDMPAAFYEADQIADPMERYKARQKSAPLHRDEWPRRGVSPPKRTAGENIALVISAGTDMIKGHGRGRGRADSDASEGMDFADVAPVDAMQCCNRCHRPPEGYLHSDGVCEKCRIYMGQKREEMVKLAPLEPSHSNNANDSQRQGQIDPAPVSPPYMKLAGKKKLRRVRQTMYEDPGNPFAESEHEGDLAILNMSHPPAATRSSTLTQASSKQSLLSGRPFDDAVESPAGPPTLLSPVVSPNMIIHAPTPVRRGTPTVVQEHHPSLSGAIFPGLSSSERPDGNLAAPSMRRQDESISFPRRPRQKPSQRDEARDTKFYGFYDEILKD